MLDDDLLEAIGPPRARRGELAPLLGGASVAGEQGLRRGLHEGEQRHAARIPLGRRLRRHALIYEAFKKTGGNTDGEKLVEAMKGMALDKPARPDDDRSRDARRRSRTCTSARSRSSTASSWNIEFDTIENVKDRALSARESGVGTMLRLAQVLAGGHRLTIGNFHLR